MGMHGESKGMKGQRSLMALRPHLPGLRTLAAKENVYAKT